MLRKGGIQNATTEGMVLEMGKMSVGGVDRDDHGSKLIAYDEIKEGYLRHHLIGEHIDFRCDHGSGGHGESQVEFCRVEYGAD